MKYKMVWGSMDSIEDKVNSWIKLGWVPQGGVAIDSAEELFSYSQAMIKEGDR